MKYKRNNNLITGRIARSLQRAGICVLIGGFTAFLPYKRVFSSKQNNLCKRGRVTIFSNFEFKTIESPVFFQKIV